MIRELIVFGSFLYCSLAHPQSSVDAAHVKSVSSTSIDVKTAEQCGMTMYVPNLQNVYDQTIGFGCTGTYENGNTASLDMDFQYDPNERNGGERIGFVVYGVGINKYIASGDESNFRLPFDEGLPTLWKGVAYGGSNCGDPVVKTTITPIRGSNWHGWVAEESFRKAYGRCKPAKEYTSRYRCIHVMVGNDKMTAQIAGVCLLRKREYSLENGFSYDLFMDMLKTLRFTHGRLTS